MAFLLDTNHWIRLLKGRCPALESKLDQVHPFDDAAAEEAGRLRHDLERRGLVIGPHDLQIASIALTRGWTLVTGNMDEFRRVPNLMLEDWTSA
jgi:tRNA(fMet)-specific endonuclease VapC